MPDNPEIENANITQELESVSYEKEYVRNLKSVLELRLKANLVDSVALNEVLSLLPTNPDINRILHLLKARW